MRGFKNRPLQIGLLTLSQTCQEYICTGSFHRNILEAVVNKKTSQKIETINTQPRVKLLRTLRLVS